MRPIIKLSGIYKITHSNGSYYIGKSVDIFSRWQSHYTDIKSNKHSSPMFTFHWLYSNPKDWKFEILEAVSFDDYKKSHHLPGDFLKKSFSNYLTDLEKKHMALYSKNWALNQDKRHFS
jgi:hypothetical protein